MYKCLRKLLLLAALLLPWATQAQSTTCDLTFYMYDEYGDGWNYSGSVYVYVYQDDSLVGAVTLSNGTYGEASVTVSSASPVVLICQGYDDYAESSFTLDGFSNLTDVYLYNYNTGDTIALLETPCISCHSPTGVTVLDVQTDAFTLSWNPIATASYYSIYLGDSVIDQVTDTFYLYTELNANTLYQAGVRSVCGDDDSSMLKTVSVTTACSAIDTLPWHDNMELAASQSYSTWFEAPCWDFLTDATSQSGVYVYNNSAYNHTPGGAQSIYWSGDSYYADYSCLILPMIDTEAIPINSLQLTFWAKSGYSSYQPKLYVGVLSDITDISTFDTVAAITVNQNGSAAWEEIVVSFDNYEGAGTRLAIRGDYTGNYWYGYLDDFTIEALPSCPPIELLTVTATASAALASWSYQANIADPNEYEVEYGPMDGSESPTTVTVTTPYVMMMNLAMGKLYYLKVRAICDDGAGAWDSTTFNTIDLPCVLLADNAIEAAIGNALVTSAYLPNYGYYDYALSQQVYSKEEIGKSGAIERISIKPSAAPQQRHVEIYLGHTPMTSLASSFYVPVDSSELVKVYDGTPSMIANEWYTFVLDSVFNYDTAKGNLLVCFRDMTGDFNSSYNYYYVHTMPNVGNSRFLYQDNTPFDPYAPTGGYTTPYRNNIILSGGDCLELGSCVSPVAIASYVGSDSVVVSWIPGKDETEWNIDYRAAADATWTNLDTGYSSMSYEITNLTPNTIYEVRVSHECNDSLYSCTVTFRTACSAINHLPYVEDFETIDSILNATNFIPCWSINYANHPDYFYTGGNYNHTAGGSKGVQWSGDDYYGAHTTWVLPQIDTAVFAMNTLMLTFWARLAITGDDPLIVVGGMSDPTDESTFVAYDTIYVGQNAGYAWTKYTTRFDKFEGDSCSYVAIRGVHETTGWVLYIDDITLAEIPPCEPVEDIEVVTGPASAIVSWNSYGYYQGALVEYLDTINNTWYAVVVNGQDHAMLNDLYAGMPYQLLVTALCSDNTLSSTVNGNFKTKKFPCLVESPTQGFLDTIGDGSTTDFNLPSYSYYKYSFTEQIYTKAELGKSGPIQSISVRPASSAGGNRNMEIYMGHTTLATLNNFTHPSDMTKVFGPAEVPYVAGQWATYELDETFNYDTSLGNLLIAFRDITGSFIATNTFYVHYNPNGNSLYIYTDNGSYDPYTITGGTTTIKRNDIIINAQVCDSASNCAAPPVLITDVTPYTVDVVWAPGNEETSWNVYYRIMGDDIWTIADSGMTDNGYQFTGLQSGMHYEFRIESVCEIMLSTVVSATTECAAISQLPFAETFNSWGSGMGVLPTCWTKAGSGADPYIYASYNHSGTGGGCVATYTEGDSTYSNLTLPALDTNVYHVNETKLAFYVLGSSSTDNPPAFIIGVLDDNTNASTFTPVDTVVCTAAADEWQSFVVPLTSYTGTGSYICLRSYAPNGGSCYAYIDDITLHSIASCPRVDSLMAGNATATSTDLSWNDYSDSTTQWQIEYGPFGFEQGTGTLVTASSNPFTLSNPTCNAGSFYVRPLCSTGDTGYWSLTAGTFYLGQSPATIPYSYDFESATEWNNWQGSYNNLERVWARGTAVAHNGSYSMYLSADQGATYVPYYNNAVVNAAIFRDIDFGTADTSFDLSFYARAGGSTTGNHDGLMVFLTDPTLTPIASNATLTSPWGHVDDLDTIAYVHADTTWQHYKVTLDNLSGVQRLVFFWFNQNSGTSYSPLLEPAAVDDINIGYTSCPRPSNLTTTNVGVHTATIAWQGASNANYEVVYRLEGGSDQTTTCSTNHITLTGLDSLAAYSIQVRKVCGAGDTSRWSDGYQFATALCDNGAVAMNYDASLAEGTTSYGPLGYSNYNYSYVQTIVDSAYMASIGSTEVGYFGFNPTTIASGSACYTGMNIYLANVPESDLSSGWILPNSTSHIFQQVLTNDTLNFTETGWQIFPLDNTFVWDGHSNVLVAVLRNDGSTGASPSFSAHSASGKMRYVYREYTPYNYANPGVIGLLSSYTGDIILVACSEACTIPKSLNVTNITYESATLNWTGSNDSYELQYKAVTDAAWTGPVTVSSNSYQLTGLTDTTVYLFQVRSICVDGESGDTIYSDWAEDSFTTLHIPCFVPTELEAQAVTYATATLNWTENGLATQWSVRVWNSQYDQTFSTSSHPFTITDLTLNTEYNVAVSAQCDEETASAYSDTIIIQTPNCQPPTSLTVTNTTVTSATIAWSGSDAAMQWTVHLWNSQYEQTFTTSSQPFTVTGLTQNTDYYVAVSAQCSEETASDFSDTIAIHTLTCTVPTSLTVTNTTATSATIVWGGSGIAFDVEYGDEHFSEGVNTQVVHVTGNTYTITGLEPEYDYSVSVRAECEEGVYSTYCAQVDFTTLAQGEGIENAGTANVTLYPNPTSNATTIAISGVNGEVEITLVDLSGRVVMTDSMSCTGDCAKKLEVSGLSQGAYFVRLSGENVNMVKKVVVK